MSKKRIHSILAGILLAWILVSLVAAPVLAQDPSLEPPYRVVLRDGSEVTIIARELSYFGNGWWYQLEDGQWVWESWFSLEGAVLVAGSGPTTSLITEPRLVESPPTANPTPKPTATSAVVAVRKTLEAATAAAVVTSKHTPQTLAVVTVTATELQEQPRASSDSDQASDSLKLLVLLLTLAAIFGFLLARWWKRREPKNIRRSPSQDRAVSPPSRRPPVKVSSADDEANQPSGKVHFEGHLSTDGSLDIGGGDEERPESTAPVVGDPSKVAQPRRTIRPANNLNTEKGQKDE